MGELSLQSESFRRLWSRHDVHETSDGIKRIVHPIVGLLDLRDEALTTNGADGQLLATIISQHAQRQEHSQDARPDPRI